MKIQIDTVAKVIKPESSENLGALVDALTLMLPNDLWKEFKLETNTVITWSNPITWKEIFITPYPYPTYPICPSYPSFPWFYQNAPKNNVMLCNGIFNVEM